MTALRVVYVISIAVAILLCVSAPEPIAWSVALLTTGWIGGLSFGIFRHPRWFFELFDD